MQEERSVANGTPKREPSGPVVCGEKSPKTVRVLVENYGVRTAEMSSPTGNLDLRGFEDPDENFVQLVNSVQIRPVLKGDPVRRYHLFGVEKILAETHHGLGYWMAYPQACNKADR